MKLLSQQHNSRALWGMAEAVFLTALVLALSFTSNPDDPLLFHAAFPWLWFAPVLLALRYGLGPGLLSVIIIIATFVLTESTQSLDNSYHRIYLLCGFILTLICAEFASSWSARLRRAELAAIYAEHRLNQLAHSYHLINNSHLHLEQSLIAKPVTLRSAVHDCIQLLKASSGEITTENSQRFLDLCAYYCNLEQSAMYLFVGDELVSKPIAHCGEYETLQMSDPLVKKCLQQHLAVFHAVNELADEEESHYLVCAPLVTSDGDLLGIVTVTKMPFIELHEETLKLLSVLLGYYSNQVWAIENALQVTQRYSDCPIDFAAQLLKLRYLRRQMGIRSALVAFYVKSSPEQKELVDAIARQQRGLDLTWVHSEPERTVVMVLMPFTESEAIQGYRARIDAALLERFGSNVLAGSLYSRWLAVDRRPVHETIAQLLGHANAE